MNDQLTDGSAITRAWFSLPCDGISNSTYDSEYRAIGDWCHW